MEGDSKTAMEVPRTMSGRLLSPVSGVNNVTTFEGRSDSGNNQYQQTELGDSTKTRQATKNSVTKTTLGWTGLRHLYVLQNGQQRGPYSLT